MLAILANGFAVIAIPQCIGDVLRDKKRRCAWRKDKSDVPILQMVENSKIHIGVMNLMQGGKIAAALFCVCFLYVFVKLAIIAVMTK